MEKEEYKAKAKELLKKLNIDSIKKYEYTDEALELIKDYDIEYGLYCDFADDETINQIIRKEIDDNDWQRVACFLADAELNPPYGHRIDAYGNLQNVDLSDIKCWLEDIIKN